jgi:hypothetical protein
MRLSEHEVSYLSDLQEPHKKILTKIIDGVVAQLEEAVLLCSIDGVESERTLFLAKARAEGAKRAANLIKTHLKLK